VPTRYPEFTVLVDLQCPLCRREAAFLDRLDRGRGRLVMVDISADDFDPASVDRDFDTLMGTIHGVTAGGELVTGMAVFRRAWAAAGWGWVFAPTGWPVLRPVCDAAYRWFARHRLRLTGRAKTCRDGTCRT
jgi:predicted DCC family thiol-disulfide oxidoreductase YuxK